MKAAAITAMLITLGCVAQSQQGQVRDMRSSNELLSRFTAEVKWIEPVGKRECQAVPIGKQVDLNWLVGIDILSIEKTAQLFDTKGERVLLVHSPARFFAPDSPERAVGQQYAIAVFGDLKDGVPRYEYAELKKDLCQATTTEAR